MEACVLEMIVVLLRRYMRMEANALAVGSHAHVMVFEGLMFLYGMSRMSLCKKLGILTDDETPDLEPVLSTLPCDMQKAIRGAIAAEQDGRCIHAEAPSAFGLNVLESHYIWTVEEPKPDWD